MATSAPVDDQMIVKCRCGRRFGKVKPNPLYNAGLLVEGIAYADGPVIGDGGVGIGFAGYHPRPKMAVEGLVDNRKRWRCHPKCGLTWFTTDSQMIVAFVRAARAGRQELVFGDNL